ncbi:hypothetical protein acsn021_05220 [Anaerocolumna cellulosilytica]|uniref:Uncharacterized protein n=1 Tax=Anaerocolumna cellulosilytica TaxID=433286 RepID=A0A6S6QNL9_9FIRM|nr:hypothetical protein [Anaerocolumna cellulosilytica]MBB5195711.1 CDP-glycerol glycerophosphotransferase (TagB/SpsB family) [Anaerocolumna cellulosilytica]BCJ92953.1 hypothetical protein acsn021_05220 [Anaerocolumna cellulosilytica]
MDYMFNVKDKYIMYDKKEKIRIVFMIQVASFWPSIESFYEACIQDDRFDTRLILITESSVEKVQMENTREFLQNNHLQYEIYSEELLKIIQPHIAVYQPPYDVSYRTPETLSIHTKKMGTRIVYVPYGIEIADTEDARLAHFDTYVVRNSWRIYTFSEMMRQEYNKYCGNRNAVRACGLPKFDAYYNKQFNLNTQIANRVKNRKIVLWKMHFPKIIYEEGVQLQVTPYLDVYLELEKKLINYQDLFFIVMPHPMFTSSTIPCELAKKAGELLSRLKGHENVFIDIAQDYRDSLFNADAIMIDRSAIMVEAAVCDVPILYLYNQVYTEKMTPPIQMLVDTYNKGTTIEDIEKFLNQVAINETYDFSERKIAINKVLPNLDGMNGVRIKENLIKGLEEEERTEIKLVLFGAGQVCRYYLERLHLLVDSRFKLVAFSDNDSNKWGEKINEISIVSPEKLKDIEFDLLIITTEQYHMQIKRKLVYELYLDEEKIMRLDYFCEYVKGNL